MAINPLARAIRTQVPKSDYATMFTNNISTRPGIRRVKLWAIKYQLADRVEREKHVAKLKRRLQKHLTATGFTEIEIQIVSSTYGPLRSISVYARPPAHLEPTLTELRKRKTTKKLIKPPTRAKAKPVKLSVCPHCGAPMKK